MASALMELSDMGPERRFFGEIPMLGTLSFGITLPRNDLQKRRGWIRQIMGYAFIGSSASRLFPCRRGDVRSVHSPRLLVPVVHSR